MKSKLVLGMLIGSLNLFNTAIAKDQSAEQLLQTALNLRSNIISTPQEAKYSNIDMNFSFTNFKDYNQVISRMDDLRKSLFTLSQETNLLSQNSQDTYKELVVWSATTKVSVFAFESTGFFNKADKAPKVLRTILINNCEIPDQIKSILQAEFQKDIRKIRNDFMQLRTGSSGGGRHGSNRTLTTLGYSEATSSASEIDSLYRTISHASSALSEAQRDTLNSLATDISSDTYETGTFGAYNVLQVFRHNRSTEYINAINNDSCM